MLSSRSRSESPDLLIRRTSDGIAGVGCCEQAERSEANEMLRIESRLSARFLPRKSTGGRSEQKKNWCEGK
ncbi:hypothetical protein BDZ97DRAFT_1867141 [Flammula alnicola]|nr:hypothetical protein BDZ97DRAFT_1867141 [Flammula alnicola]